MSTSNDRATGSSGVWFQRMLVVATLALAVLVVILARQNRELKRQLGEARAPVASLASGERLGPIELLDPSGPSRPLDLAGDGGRTLLLFFTPTCPACRATIPVWQQLVSSLDAPPRIVGIELAPQGAPGASEELTTDGWPFPVFRVDPEGSAGLGKISFVPATVIVDGDGVVERVWFGALDAGDQDELRAALASG